MVAEVASRFEDTRAFLKAMTQLGFRTVSKVRRQVCPQVCHGLGTGCTRNKGAQGRSRRRGMYCGPAWCAADMGLVKADGGGRDWYLGDCGWENKGTSMHRGGVPGEGLEVPGTVGVHCGSFGWGLDGVLGSGSG